jgi:integrase
MGRKPTQLPQGVSLEGNRIIVRFTWNGERIREPINLSPTPKNIERAGTLRSEITQRIRFNNFTLIDYAKYFPNSRRVPQNNAADLFGQLAQEWLDHVEVSPNTRGEYKKALNRYWMPLYAPRPISSVAYSELRADVNRIEWSSAKTRNNALIPLRGVFAAAHEDEVIDRDPAARLKNLKHQKPPIDPFSQEEAELVINHLYEEYTGREAIHAAYFEFAFFTGMRSSEMLALRWSDIDFRRKYARVEKAQSKGRLNEQTKTAKVRDVLLNDRALHALKIAKALTYLADGAVFAPYFALHDLQPGDGYKTEKAQRSVFTRALKRLQMRHRPAYNTRHTYATMLLMAGANLHFVAAQLGHSPVMTATVYGKWISGKADAAEMAKLAALIG